MQCTWVPLHLGLHLPQPTEATGGGAEERGDLRGLREEGREGSR